MRKVEYKEAELTDKELRDYLKLGWRVESIDDKELIGRCEWCENLIMDGDKYDSDVEGVLQCSGCSELEQLNTPQSE